MGFWIQIPPPQVPLEASRGEPLEVNKTLMLFLKKVY